MWLGSVKLNFSLSPTREILELLREAYQDADQLQQLAQLAGLQVGKINFNRPPDLLPMLIMQRAAAEGKLVGLLAEVLVDESARGIHEPLWKALGSDLPRVQDAALRKKTDYRRLTELPSPLLPFLNSGAASLEKIVEAASPFINPAVFREDLAKCEGRTARLDVDGKGCGTAWLVARDIVLTAYHVIEGVESDWTRVSLLFDYKKVPSLNNQVLSEGRSVALSDKPLIASSKYAAMAEEASSEGPSQQFLDFALLRLAEPVGEQGIGPTRNGPLRGWFKLSFKTQEFRQDAGLFILGHPRCDSPASAGPLKLTFAFPSDANLTKSGSRVRYRVNTESGSSGSPVLDTSFAPVALHHLGVSPNGAGGSQMQWHAGFNQGVPLHLIVAKLRENGVADRLEIDC